MNSRILCGEPGAATWYHGIRQCYDSVEGTRVCRVNNVARFGFLFEILLLWKILQIILHYPALVIVAVSTVVGIPSE